VGDSYYYDDGQSRLPGAQTAPEKPSGASNYSRGKEVQLFPEAGREVIS
jgi:hypothetical protein